MTRAGSANAAMDGAGAAAAEQVGSDAGGAQPGGGRSRVRNLLLDVVVNGSPIGMIGEFQDRNGALFATRRELAALGFKLEPALRAGPPGEELPIAGLRGVTAALQEHTQTIVVTASAAALQPTILGSGQEGASALPLDGGLGAVLDYDIVGTVSGGRALAEMLLDARVYSPWGVAASSWVASNAELQGPPVTRLDSNFTVTDPDAMRQYRAGDIIAGGLAWTRPVRMGGLQVSTDFATRPDLVTFPVPTIAGQVAVPSSVDVLVNGIEVLSRAVPPGPFEVRQLPVVTGVDDVSVVVRNAAGEQSTQTLALYSSRLLLTPGLSELSAEVGSVRLDYGVTGEDYRSAAGSVSYRYGVRDWLTVEAHAEASSGGTTRGLGTGGAGVPANGAAGMGAGGMAGGGVAFPIGHVGVVSADIAGSRFGALSGGLFSASFERIAPVFSLSGSIQAADPGFRDIASAFGDVVPRLQARASLGLTFPSLGTFGIAYVLVRRRAYQAAAGGGGATDASPQSPFGAFGLALTPEAHVSLLSASFSRPFFGGRVNVYATGFHDFAQPSNNGLMAGISIPLGRRSTASLGVSEEPGGPGGGSASGSFQASQSASLVGETGFQVIATAGRPAREMATGSYRSPWGTVEAGVDRVGGDTAVRLHATGALALADANLFVTNTIYDSFAVIDTDGTPGIGVLQENRPVGRTDDTGTLLVPDLRAFDTNRLAIDPDDVPFDADIGAVSVQVRPQDRSGVIVHFPVRPSRGATVRLQTEGGATVEVGSMARLDGAPDQADLVVGYDGAVFVTGLQAHNLLSVEPVEGPRCVARFDYAPQPGMLPDIGPVPCKAALP